MIRGANRASRRGSLLRQGPSLITARGALLADFTKANASIVHPIAAAGTAVAVAGGKTTLSCTNLGAASMALTWDAQFDFSAGNRISIEMGFPAPMANKAVRLILATDELSFSFTDYAQVYLVTGGVQPSKRQTFTLLKTDFTIAGAFNWANVKHVEVWVDNLTAYANATDSVEVYRVYAGRVAKPCVVLSLDDASSSQFTEAYQGTNNGGVGLPDYGFPATVYCSGSTIGTGGFMTLAQLQELYAAGWDVGNQGYAEAPFSVQAGIAWAAGVATLTATGHGYSNGNEVPVEGADPIELNGTKTVGGAAANTFTYATTLAGSGNALGFITIPQGTLQDHLDNAQDQIDWLLANGMPRAAYHYAYSQGAHNDAAVTGLAALGIKTARTTRRLNDGTTPATPQEAILNFVDPRGVDVDLMRMWCIELNASVSVLKVTTTLQFALDRGYSVHIYAHGLVAAGATGLDYNVADYFAIVDAIDTAVQSGAAEVLTITQWWERAQRQRYPW